MEFVADTSSPLTADLLSNILSKFTFVQKVQAAQVCKIWKDVVYKKFMWREKKIKFREDIDDRRLDTMIPSLIQRDINIITISQELDKNHIYTRYVRCVQKILRNVTSIKTIEFSNASLSDKQVKNIFFKGMPNIKEVKIGAISLNSLVHLINKCYNVESLSLECSYLFVRLNGRVKHAKIQQNAKIIN